MSCRMFPRVVLQDGAPRSFESDPRTRVLGSPGGWHSGRELQLPDRQRNSTPTRMVTSLVDDEPYMPLYVL